MKLFGNIVELLRLVFRDDTTNKEVLVEPNPSASYSAASTTITLPENSGDDTLVGRTSNDQGASRLNNKDLDSATTRISDGTNTAKITPATGSNTFTAPTPGTGTTEELVGKDSVQTLTNKTLTSPVLDTGVSGTALNTDLATTAESSKIPTAAATKAYADTVSGDVQTNLTNHLNDTADAHDASAISNVAAGNIAATDVQAALNELDDDKVAKAGDTMTGDLDMNNQSLNNVLGVNLQPAGTVDVDAAGALNVGTTNATTVVYGKVDDTTDHTVRGDVTITGDLTVNGTTTTLNTETLDVEDKNITVSLGGNDAASEGAGLTIDRTGTKGSLIYKDASASKFAVGPEGSEVDIVTTTTTQSLENKALDSTTTSIEDTADDTKKLKLDLTGLTTSTTRTQVIQDVNDTFVMRNTTDTLTNKTLTSPQINEAVTLTATSTELNQLDGVTVGGTTAGDIVTLDDAQTLTAKTLDGGELNDDSAALTIDASTSGLTLDGTVSGTMVKDEDDFVSNSDTHLATQQSIKTYVDNAVSAGAGGSGAGEINFIENGNFNVNTDGWVTYKASATPPSIADTSGTTTPTELTLTRDTSTHLIEGAASGRITHTANPEANVGVSYDFQIPAGQQSQTHKVELTYYSATTSLAGSVRVYMIRDIGGSPVLEELSILGFGTTDTEINRYQLRTTFRAFEGIQNYRLVIHHSSITGSAFDLFIDSVVVGPKDASIVPGVGKDGNLFSFGTGENLSGWARFDAASSPPATYSAADPADPTSVNLVKTVTGTLWNNYVKAVTFSSGSTNDGIQTEFWLPRALESTLLAFDLDYSVPSLGTRTTGDIQLAFVGQDNTVVYPSVRDLVLPTASSSDVLRYRATVALPTSQKWRMIMQNATVVAATTTIYFDAAYLGTRNGAQQGFDGIWKTYTDSDVTITATNVTGWGIYTDSIELTPYKTTGGEWFMDVRIAAFHDADNSYYITIEGAEAKGTTANTDSTILTLDSSGLSSQTARAYGDGSGNTRIDITFVSNNTRTRLNGKIPLTGKPTWADFDPIATIYPTTDDLAVTSWRDFTGVWAGTTATLANTVYKWRRNFENLELIVSFEIGATTASTSNLILSLPTEAGVDLTGYQTGSVQNVGNLGSGSGFFNTGYQTALVGAINANQFAIYARTGSQIKWDEFAGTNEGMHLFLSFPVSQWSGNLGQVPPIGLQIASDTQYGIIKGTSGTYTPTVTNVGNVGGSLTIGEAKYTYINGIVTVFGSIDTTSVTANTFNELGISLPFPKTVSSTLDISGNSSVRRAGTYTNGGLVVGDATFNRATIQIFNASGNGASHSFTYSFSYEAE